MGAYLVIFTEGDRWEGLGAEGHYPQWTDGGSGNQKGEVTCPRTHAL